MPQPPCNSNTATDQRQEIHLEMRYRSECKLSLQRHRTRSTKYNRLMHTFRHRSTWLFIGTQV